MDCLRYDEMQYAEMRLVAAHRTGKMRWRLIVAGGYSGGRGHRNLAAAAPDLAVSLLPFMKREDDGGERCAQAVRNQIEWHGG